ACRVRRRATRASGAPVVSIDSTRPDGGAAKAGADPAAPVPCATIARAADGSPAARGARAVPEEASDADAVDDRRAGRGPAPCHRLRVHRGPAVAPRRLLLLRRRAGERPLPHRAGPAAGDPPRAD